MKNKLDIAELFPDNNPDYLFLAWLSCLNWAIGKAEILASFRAETGNEFQISKTPIERMIDEETGAQEDFVKQFVLWFNDAVWGNCNEEKD